MNRIIQNEKFDELFGGKFELIESGFSTGEENMNYDYDRTMLVAKGNALPMFRLYGWKPWSVSLGANQNEEDVNAEECRKRNFTIVRRPTGGRAVLHANEITYSVVLNMQEDKTVHEVYRDIHMILLEGINNLGCTDLEFNKSGTDFKNFYKESGMSVSCFASSARYEISWQGRKVIGSAQRLFGKTLLQHGSILLGSGHEQLAQLVSNADTAQKIDRLLQYILQHSVTLEEVCKREISYEECAASIFSSFI